MVLLKAPSRKPSLASRSKWSAATISVPLHAGAGELHRVAGLAFDHGAFHVELLLDLLGPLPGHLARLGQAQGVVAVDADVGHVGLLSSQGRGVGVWRGARLRQGGQAPHLGIEARRSRGPALEQALEGRHQFVVGGLHAEARLVGAREPAVVAGEAAPARRPSARRSRRAAAAISSALRARLSASSRCCGTARRARSR